MGRALFYSVSILMTISSACSAAESAATTPNSGDQNQWLTLATYVACGLGLFLVGCWASDAFARAKPEVTGREVPPREVPLRFLARRNLIVSGTIVYVIACMVIFALIVLFYKNVMVIAELLKIPEIEITEWKEALDITNPSYLLTVAFACAVFVGLLKLENDYNPVLVFRKIIYGWIGIPSLAEDIRDLILDKLVIPEAALSRACSDVPGGGQAQGDAITKSKWAELCYMRSWLEEQKRRGDEPELFHDSSFNWDQLVADFDTHRTAAMTKFEWNNGLEKLRENFATMIACYLIYTNPTRPELVTDATLFGIKLRRREQENPLTLTIVYTVTLIISCYIGVFISGALFDLANGAVLTIASLSKNAAYSVRWTGLALGNYGIPIIAILLVRYIIWRANPNRVYSRISLYAWIFVISFCLAPIGLSLSSEIFGQQPLPWSQFWSLPPTRISSAFGPALTCVLINHHLDAAIEEHSSAATRQPALKQVLISVGFTLIVLVFTLPALAGIPNRAGEWSVDKVQWVALGTVATITLSLGLISQASAAKRKDRVPDALVPGPAQIAGA
jgi:hypothetical protein